MAKPFNGLPIDYSPKKEKVEELSVKLTPCCNCGKEIEKGFYGRWGNGGVCSKACNDAQELKPRYPAPSPEFLQQLEIQDGLNDFSADA